MKRNDELALNDVLYGVSAENIVAYKVCGLKLINADLNTLEAKIVLHGGSYHCYEGQPQACQLTAVSGGNVPRLLYSDLEYAQTLQREQRYKAIEKAKENMIKAQEEYFSLVDKYKGTVSDNEIINKF